MKYKIVYLTKYVNSAVYLVGHSEKGKPIYRYSTTKAPRPMTAHDQAMVAAVLGMGF